MNLKLLSTILIGVNWKNALFRLWLTIALCWEFFILFVIFYDEFNLFAVFALTWPFLFFVMTVILYKTGKWIFSGLNEKNDFIDNMSAKIDRVISVGTLLFWRKKISEFISLKQRYVFLPILMAALVLIFASIYTQLKTAIFQPHKNTAIAWRLLEPGEQKQKSNTLYEVSAPDGAVLSIEGPNGASTEHVLEQAKALYKPKTSQ